MKGKTNERGSGLAGNVNEEGEEGGEGRKKHAVLGGIPHFRLRKSFHFGIVFRDILREGFNLDKDEGMGSTFYRVTQSGQQLAFADLDLRSSTRSHIIQCMSILSKPICEDNGMDEFRVFGLFSNQRCRRDINLSFDIWSTLYAGGERERGF